MVQSTKIKRLVGIAMMAAIAYVVMFFEFPLIPAFGYLKTDLSDLIVLIGTFIYGPVGGIAIATLRSTLHFITTGANVASLIGDVASVLASITFLLPMYFMLRKGSNPRRQIFASGTATILLAAVMGFLNLIIITPLYMSVLGMSLGMAIGKYVLFVVVPFNLIKGVILSAVFSVVYVKMMPWVKNQAAAFRH
ncbi:ECF transporter S component [Agrilactobacillus yilanensis]|uniref:Riboflavin transporter n=1 Tax=Agrilactobacillus yilanensis TaxID=2485997 RepID=A0ABW4J6L9_9LACO|nr:ECF transporter S component [Agrilactobacillus yilanensis]